MASDDFERELDRFEVDRLVKQLAAKRKGLADPPAPTPAPGRVPSAFVAFGSPTAAPAPPASTGASHHGAASQSVSQSTSQSASQSVSQSASQPLAPQTSAQSATAVRQAPNRRWSTNRLFMPPFAGGQARRSFASASALHLPSLRGFNFPALPRIAFPVFTDEQLAVITARMFVALGLVLGVAMPYWPYSNSHSWGFALYLFAVALIVITGIWGAKLTWDSRLGKSHTIAIVTVIWGLTLATVAVLPHLGFGLG